MNFGCHPYDNRSAGHFPMWWYDLRHWLYRKFNCPDKCCHVMCHKGFEGN